MDLKKMSLLSVLKNGVSGSYLKIINDSQKNQYNNLVTHVIQSWQWGEFRKSLGIPLLRYGLYQNNKLHKAFQLTLHKIPFANKYVGYLPKGPFPDQQLADALKKIGKEENCAFIKVEPNVVTSVIPARFADFVWPEADFVEPKAEASRRRRGSPKATARRAKAGIQLEKLRSELDPRLRGDDKYIDHRFKPSPRPLFTKYNFIIDLVKSEEELLKTMHPKTRYNIKVAQKHGVVVEERDDDEAFNVHLKLYFATTKRQGYLGHNENYHQKAWKILKETGMAKLLIAFYTPPGEKKKIPLTSWMLLQFKDTLYYPYGGSFDQYKNVMASNLVAWEAIKLGKKLGLKKLDLWGAAPPNVSPKDPFYGFTRFKSGMGAELVEYLGSYDLVFNWPVYWMFTMIDKLTPFKIFLLKLLGKN